jgi:hypothetical protein
MKSATQMRRKSTLPRVKAPVGERGGNESTGLGPGDAGFGVRFGGGDGDGRMRFGGGCGCGWSWATIAMLKQRKGMLSSSRRKMSVEAAGERSCMKSAAALHLVLLPWAWFIVEVAAKNAFSSVLFSMVLLSWEREVRLSRMVGGAVASGTRQGIPKEAGMAAASETC